MILCWNWLSRRLWSLETVVRSALKLPAVTLPPATVSDPVIEVVRPTAVLLWPNSTSLTRQPAWEPPATFQVPSIDVAPGPAAGAAPPAGETVAAGVAPEAAGDGDPAVLRLSGAGAFPSKKWM